MLSFNKKKATPSDFFRKNPTRSMLKTLTIGEPKTKIGFAHHHVIEEQDPNELWNNHVNRSSVLYL